MLNQFENEKAYLFKIKEISKTYFLQEAFYFPEF